MVAGLAVDAAGLASGGGGEAVRSSDGLVRIIQDSQVGGGGVGGGALQEDGK